MKRNNRGFTLVELMVAMVVLLFVSLALMQTALLSIDSNIRNILRDESVRIAEARMDEIRNTAFSNIPASTSITNTVDVRSLSQSYVINSTASDLDVLTKRIDVSVFWTWKGENYNTIISSIRRTQ